MNLHIIGVLHSVWPIYIHIHFSVNGKRNPIQRPDLSHAATSARIPPSMMFHPREPARPGQAEPQPPSYIHMFLDIYVYTPKAFALHMCK